MRSGNANHCMTKARSRALEAHLLAVKMLGRTVTRPRPGSYSWPRLRREAEEAFARGDGLLSAITRLRERHLLDHATVPSVRTMRRWFAQFGWLRPPGPEPAP